MVTKEELKNEVDKLPESFVEEVYALLNRFILHKKIAAEKTSRAKWEQSLDKFTPDFMNDRHQPTQQTRVLFD